AHWLSWRVGWNLNAARERVRVARALGALPRLAGALGCGELSYAKVRALTGVATPETEARLLAVGRAGTACHVERIIRGWRRVDRIAEARETARRHKSRALRVYQDEDGMVVVRGRLTPEAGAVLMKALAAAREQLYDQTPRTFENPGDVATEPPSRSSNSKQMPSGSSRRARCTTPSTPARPANATRSWVTSTRPCWPIPRRRANPCSRTARTFPRKRRSVSRATRAAWRCSTTATATSWKFPPAP